jgi:hypothetical protein
MRISVLKVDVVLDALAQPPDDGFERLALGPVQLRRPLRS